jgi:hypothetical protein
VGKPGRPEAVRAIHKEQDIKEGTGLAAANTTATKPVGKLRQSSNQHETAPEQISHCPLRQIPFRHDWHQGDRAALPPGHNA